jgi:hypothetical protein
MMFLDQARHGSRWARSGRACTLARHEVDDPASYHRVGKEVGFTAATALESVGLKQANR